MFAPFKYLETKFISISHTFNIVNTSWTKFPSSRPFWLVRSSSTPIIVSCSFLQFSPRLAVFLALNISPCTSHSGMKMWSPVLSVKGLLTHLISSGSHQQPGAQLLQEPKSCLLSSSLHWLLCLSISFTNITWKEAHGFCTFYICFLVIKTLGSRVSVNVKICT